MNILTPEELAQITGYKRRGDQIKWLRRRGIEPFISSTGAVIVFAGVLEEAQRRASGMELQNVMRRGPLPNLRKYAGK
ncbi:MAG TPA: DUF4224 domain-containing protein [Gammaproteobacteria bacterium]|nr:DUF4224 domain-containing protein [Gammaproteobacteria bacterium]